MSAPHRPWAYSAFPVEVSRSRALSPRFVRITFRGDALRHFAPWGIDQRIKLVLPLADGTFSDTGLLDEPTPHPSDWYTRWKALDEDRRNVLRTYTPAAVRAADHELDVDFFLHDPAGPASAWAARARPGDRVVITGPDERVGWTGYGIHWAPGAARRALLVGDETAIPAMRGIVTSLPADHLAHVILRVEDPADDVLTPDVWDHPGVTVDRVIGGGVSALRAAVRSWADRSEPPPHDDGQLIVWLAGESGDVTAVRRHLVREVGVEKTRIAFLGYWRRGGPLVD